MSAADSQRLRAGLPVELPAEAAAGEPFFGTAGERRRVARDDVEWGGSVADLDRLFAAIVANNHDRESCPVCRDVVVPMAGELDL